MLVNWVFMYLTIQFEKSVFRKKRPLRKYECWHVVKTVPEDMLPPNSTSKLLEVSFQIKVVVSRSLSCGCWDSYCQSSGNLQLWQQLSFHFVYFHLIQLPIRKDKISYDAGILDKLTKFIPLRLVNSICIIN